MGQIKIYDRFKAESFAVKNRLKIQAAFKTMKEVDIIEALGLQSGSIQLKKQYYDPHPKFVEHIQACQTKIEKFRKTAKYSLDGKFRVTISVGDSIVAFSEKELVKQIDLNFNLPGDSGLGFLRVLQHLLPLMEGIIVDYVVVGCFVGNGLLNFQDYNWAIKEFYETWDGMRALLPRARFIAYGVPPTYNLYASSVRFDFNGRILLQKVIDDKNAVVTMLQRGYAGPLGLFPSVEMSVDTIHLTERGKLRLYEDIRKGKFFLPGTILN